jgi:D-serine deaminase-like pyridoxal phosphate-dependent protein
MSKLRGSYPGGPRRGRDAPAEGDDSSSRARSLESAEEIDARMGRAAARRRADKKRKRAWSIFAAALLLAGGAGLYLGFLTHRTSEQLTDEREAERQGDLSDQITSETNRMLMELWRMEDVEFQRNRGGP